MLQAGDEVLITHLEHHANIVPWQMVCEQTGAKLMVAPMDARGEVHLEAVDCADESAHHDCSPARMSRMRWARFCRCGALIAAAKARGIATLDRRRAGRSAHAGRRAGSGLRLLRVLRPQDVRPHRHRRALRPRAAARAHAALAGRRRHDPGRDLRQDDLQRACRTSSRPARPTSPAPSAWARRSIICQGWTGTPPHAHEHALLASRHRAR